jgi:tRNA (adenine37-N6)-methyltransferase
MGEQGVAGTRKKKTDDRIELIPVGVVHSPIHETNLMPVQGVRGQIEIFSPYLPALDGVETSSHLILLAWMHKGQRDLLRARARKISEDLPEKGVFSLRSPSRPNPVSVSVVKLLGSSGEGLLDVDCIDCIDGTPVIDIKPYQPGWDCVFSATHHDRSIKIQKMGQSEYRQMLIREAVNYHGEWCPGTAIAVRMAECASHVLGGDLGRPEVHLFIGGNPCITDSLVGITAAREGSGRLSKTEQVLQNGVLSFGLSVPGCRVDFTISGLPEDIPFILSCMDEELFSIRIHSA